MWSHPLWVCGLKFDQGVIQDPITKVTPFMGVWIEIFHLRALRHRPSRHPLYACVDWNNLIWDGMKSIWKSHPLWVCGLKFPLFAQFFQFAGVTPFMGVWIEIGDYCYQ